MLFDIAHINIISRVLIALKMFTYPSLSFTYPFLYTHTHGHQIQGVMCFSYSHSLDLIATGSIDHMVRLWNPYVPTKAVGVLAGHSTTVLDTLIHREKGLVYSLSQDLVSY